MEKSICIARGKRRECVGCAKSVPFEIVGDPEVKEARLKVVCPDIVITTWAKTPSLNKSNLVTKVILEKEIEAFEIEGTGLFIHRTWDNSRGKFMAPRLWSISTKEGFRVVSNTEEMHRNDFLDMCSPLFNLTGWEDHLALLMGDGEHKKLMNLLKKVCGFI